MRLCVLSDLRARQVDLYFFTPRDARWKTATFVCPMVVKSSAFCTLIIRFGASHRLKWRDWKWVKCWRWCIIWELESTCSLSLVKTPAWFPAAKYKTVKVSRFLHRSRNQTKHSSFTKPKCCFQILYLYGRISNHLSKYQTRWNYDW